MNTTEKIIRQLSALDAIGDLAEKLAAIYNLPDAAHEFNRPAIARPAPPVILRASYDVRSAWHDVTRSA